MNWVYQILKALLDWLRETPPTDVQHGKAPEALKDDLAAQAGQQHGQPDDQGGPGAKR